MNKISFIIALGAHSLDVKIDSSDLKSLLTHVGGIDVCKITHSKGGGLTWFGLSERR